MKRPRDLHVAHRIGRVQAARLYSNVVSPPVMFAVLGLLLALSELPLIPALAWAAAYGFVVSLLPILFVLYLLRTGRIAELHMSNTRERHWPYAIAVACAGGMYALLSLLDGPELLRCLSLFNVVELVALGLINVVWLISIHATAVTALMLLVGLVFGWWWSLLVVPLVASVTWVRLYLRRHTMAQVLAGMGLGMATVLALVAGGCFAP